jgi:ADP-dependent NAD(P)H-hydrate dehydratase / NAD(P)H-hydrate epimerase
LIPVLSSAEARAFDRYLGERCAVPSLLLMENAGRAAALVIHQRLARTSRVLCVCGTGNNGGDGFVVARQLLGLGHSVRVLLSGKKETLGADARVNFDAWVGLGGRVQMLPPGSDVESCEVFFSDVDAVVDGLLGTGLSRELEGSFRAVVESLNHARLTVFALDIPSGLNGDTGAVMGVAVRAGVTITFGHPKLGLLTSGAPDHCGELVIADLGVPQELGPACQPSAYWVERKDVARLLPAREVSTHKGRSGRVLVVAGSVGKTGAALLASTAALRAGGGLVTICTFPDAAQSLDQRVVEVMTRSIDPGRVAASLDVALDGVDVVVIGPGLGLSEAAREVVEHVVFGWDGRKVLDADAITLVSPRASELRRAPGRCLLTPHPGELGRLLEVSATEVEAQRHAALARALALTGQTVLLKGPHTLIGEPGAIPWVTSTGHPALATGGSGDVLSGVCGALAVSLPLMQAGAAAAFVHGEAARLWVNAHAGADRGLLARELADHLPEALAALRGSAPGAW